MSRRIAVRGIIVKNGKLFVQTLKHKDDPNAFWSTPGGGLDDKESVIDGLTREMIEETGKKPVIGNLLYVQQYHDSEQEHMEFFFHIKNAEDYEEIDLAVTTHGMIEVAENGFLDPKTAKVFPLFLRERDIEADILGSSAVFFDYLNNDVN